MNVFWVFADFVEEEPELTGEMQQEYIGSILKKVASANAQYLNDIIKAFRKLIGYTELTIQRIDINKPNWIYYHTFFKPQMRRRNAFADKTTLSGKKEAVIKIR